uniref:Secreted protein n=1 Tax=Streptomyces sp. NBC_01401 TaxID=2903854 RepID=A0AAU3GQ88_9ACTN
MRNTLRKIAIATGVASAALVLGTTQAMAAPATTWTVSPDPAPFTAVSTNTVLEAGGIPMTCPEAGAGGTGFSATGNPGHVADIESAYFGTSAAPCTSILGPVAPVTSTSPPWRIQAVDYDDATGVTTGYIDNISAEVTVLSCTFTVSGEVNATYANDTDVLSVEAGGDHVLNVSDATAGCAGLIEDGMNPSFTGDYAVDGVDSIVGS